MDTFQLRVDYGRGVKKEREASFSEVLAARREALENAKVALRSNNVPSDIKHFVYYTEYQHNAIVYMEPIEFTDNGFYDRIAHSPADYVGALHRR